jgi:hypothetical protein
MIGLNSTPGAPANVSLLGHAIALPAVFVNFFVAFCYFQILHTGLNGLLVGEFARTAASIRYGQKGAMASRISYDIDSSWAMSVTPFFGFLNSGKLHLAFSTLGAFSIFFPLGLVVLALAVDVVQVSVQGLLVEGIFSLSGVMSFSSIMLVVFSTLFAICFFIPFYFSRNADFVRWNFLFPLLYRNCNRSPTVDRWVKENEAKAKR